MLAGQKTRLGGVVARGRAFRVRLTKPVPACHRQSDELCAVPAGLPANPEGAKAPLPSPAPYYVVGVRSRWGRLVMERNRFYRGPRPACRSDHLRDRCRRVSGRACRRSGKLDSVRGHAPRQSEARRGSSSATASTRRSVFVVPGHSAADVRPQHEAGRCYGNNDRAAAGARLRGRSARARTGVRTLRGNSHGPVLCPPLMAGFQGRTDLPAPGAKPTASARARERPRQLPESRPLHVQRADRIASAWRRCSSRTSKAIGIESRDREVPVPGHVREARHAGGAVRHDLARPSRPVRGSSGLLRGRRGVSPSSSRRSTTPADSCRPSLGAGALSGVRLLDAELASERSTGDRCDGDPDYVGVGLCEDRLRRR